VRKSQRDAGFVLDEQEVVVTRNRLDVRDREHALKCEMAAQVLRTFGTLRLEVTGLSMLPSVWPGDILVIERREMEGISAGDIILFAREDKLVAHRVLRKTMVADETCAITRGDGLLSADEPVSSVELLGRVRYVVRAGKLVMPEMESGVLARVTVEMVRRSGWIARILAFVRRSHGGAWRRKIPCRS
jgi:signal peptidase I